MDNTEIFIKLQAAYWDLGATLDEVRDYLEVKVCPSCKHVIPAGKHHEPFNGNQLFACITVDGPYVPQPWEQT